MIIADLTKAYFGSEKQFLDKLISQKGSHESIKVFCLENQESNIPSIKNVSIELKVEGEFKFEVQHSPMLPDVAR